MENQYIIKGGNPLHGEVVIGGAICRFGNR